MTELASQVRDEVSALSESAELVNGFGSVQPSMTINIMGDVVLTRSATTHENGDATDQLTSPEVNGSSAAEADGEHQETPAPASPDRQFEYEMFRI